MVSSSWAASLRSNTGNQAIYSRLARCTSHAACAVPGKQQQQRADGRIKSQSSLLNLLSLQSLLQLPQEKTLVRNS